MEPERSCATRVLNGGTSERIDARHEMRSSTKATSNAAFQSGRDALPRAPLNPSAQDPPQCTCSHQFLNERTP